METIYPLRVKKKNKKFKSYYVVWKPDFIFLKFKKIISLNRTMQYGNKFLITVFGCQDKV